MLKDPEARRGLRSVVNALVPLVLLYLLRELITAPSTDKVVLTWIALGELVIIALGVIFYGIENGIRAVKVDASTSGVKIDVDGGNQI